MTEKKPLLSICIPSHNRFENLIRIVNSLLLENSFDYEIVIVDNCSDNDVKKIILESNKIKVYKRNKMIDGVASPRDSLNFGNGIFRMLCMDKDFISGECLGSFLHFLNQNQGVAGGYCCLNTKKEKKNKIVTNNFSKYAYKVKHPSGFFIREDVLEKDNIITNYLSKDSLYYNFPFSGDVFLARCINMGGMAIYNRPLVYTEKTGEATKIKTKSYNIDNLFFLPKNKRKYFGTYIYDVNTQDINYSEYKKTVFKLCYYLLNDCTVLYKNNMKNDITCSHYNIEKKKVTVKEMLIEVRKCLTTIFENNSIGMSRILLIAGLNVILCKVLFKIFINELKFH